MKLVVDIPESIYDAIMDDEMISREQLAVLENHIYHGTPLPKGHGRLIYADELKKHKYHDSNRFENAVAVAQIDWADTIIEADTESEEV